MCTLYVQIYTFFLYTKIYQKNFKYFFKKDTRSTWISPSLHPLQMIIFKKEITCSSAEYNLGSKINNKGIKITNHIYTIDQFTH